MENIEKLNKLVEKAVTDGHSEIPTKLYKEILDIVKSRVDMYHPLDIGPSILSLPFQKESS